eukprot:COSAG06_NODE_4622_length_4092_cov_2.411971_6_plen_255_part_00
MPPRRRSHLASGRAARRLEAVATALRAAGPAVGEISESLKPLPLDVEGGGVAQWKLDEIAGKRDRALDAKDYRLASELHDLHTILTTAEPSDRAVFESYPDPETSTVEEQAQFFYRCGNAVVYASFYGHLPRQARDKDEETLDNTPDLRRRFGFCVLPRVFTGDHFQQLRAAWRRRQRPAVEKRNASYYENTGLQRRLEGKETVLFSHLYIKVIILPRQARDKHRENSFKKGVFRSHLHRRAHRGAIRWACRAA